MPLAEDLEEIVPGHEFRDRDLRTLYWIDGKGTLIFRQYPVRGADIESFRFYQGGFGKDRKHCYCANGRLTNADPETFHALSFAYFKDRETVWAVGGKIKGADAESFVACDDGGIDDRGLRAPHGYGKDKARVYYYDAHGTPQPVRKALPESFQSMNDENFGKDAESVFCGLRPLPKADVARWRKLGRLYSTDETRVYYLHNVLKDADLDSFEALPSSGVQLARDKNRWYVSGSESSRENFEKFLPENKELLMQEIRAMKPPAP